MLKTSVYLPERLKRDLEKLAAEERRSEAEIIREAISLAVQRRRRPRPRLPLTTKGTGDPQAARKADQLLEGFGQS